MVRLIILWWITLISALSGHAQPYGNEWIDFSKTYYKFGVREQRFYRIPVTTLTAAGLGSIPAEQFQLWRDGEEVPLFTSVATGPLPANGFIEFFGTPNTGKHETELYSEPWHHTQPERSFFNDSAYYYLTVNPAGKNKRFESEENNVLNTTLPADSFYMHTANGLAGSNSINQGRARTIGANFFRSSIWDMGESFSSGQFSSTRPIQFNFTSLRAFRNGPPMELNYGAAGNTTTSRNIILSMNDKPFDTIWVPLYQLTLSKRTGISLDNIINDGINFKPTSDNTIWFENVTINAFRLTYPRQFFHNQQTPLALSIPANTNGNHIRIAALPHIGVPPLMYDITNLKRYIGVIKQDSSLFELKPSSKERQLVVGSLWPSYIRTISALRPIQFRDFLNPAHQSNYIIISSNILRSGPEDMVEAYRAYRSSNIGGGYNAGIYEMDELADQFGYGTRKNPLAIRRFLKFALANFQQKPKMVFLIGKGSIYYSAYGGSGVVAELLNGVPTWGHPGSDNLLVAENNLNPVPLIPIGRLSAVSPNEIKIYLDKVKEYEALQFKRPLLPSDNAWRKNIIQLIGGNIDNVSSDFYDMNVIRTYFKDYEQSLTTPKLGGSTYTFQSVENPNFSNDMHFIEKSISEGVGLIKYFGHSSTSSLDFNLGSPDQFDNLPGRYPVYYINGCRAGSIFEYNGQRLSAREITISDNFTFAPGRGSIAFISASDIADISPQNVLSREWVEVYSNNLFGKTIGEIQQETLRKAFTQMIPSQIAYFSNKLTIEQMTLHGDPAVVPFTHQLPDFAVESSLVEVIPGRTTTELDSIRAKIKIHNLGAASTDSVIVRVERELPDGTAQFVYDQKHARLFNTDSFVVSFAINGLFEEGNNLLVARIDPGNDYRETDEDNNVAALPLIFERNNILPVWPYNYSIQHKPGILFRASTTNPVELPKQFIFQFDTTQYFNSPMLTMVDTTAAGGVIECMPALSLIPDKVYYWRAFLKNSIPIPDTPVYSFIYKPGTETGFNQSHYFQHVNSLGNGYDINEGRVWAYLNRENNLYCNHGIYPSSGTEDSHFSLTANGLKIARSACVGASIIFNVFDSLTFAPWRNSGGDYGSGGVCGPGREFNFEFRYFNHVNRKTIMDFLDRIPKGTYVAARLVVDPPYDSLKVNFWMRDTSIYGSGRSLYHSLKNQGFYELDSLNRTRTFFFVFRKDDSSSFKPYYSFSRGTSDRVYASVYAQTAGSFGKVSSPWLGPSRQWKQAQWDVSNNAGIFSFMRLELWGRTKNNDTVKLKEWRQWNNSIDVSDISANQYPYLQFRLATENATGTPTPQLNFWRLYFTPLPDGAWSSNDYFEFKKDRLKPNLDTLSFKLAFKNISSEHLQSMPVKVLIKENGGAFTRIYESTLTALQPGDTTIFSFEEVLELPEGDYTIQIEANEDGNPEEQNYFNNLAQLHFTVDGSVLPTYLKSFDVIKKDSDALITWTSTGDENLKGYTIEHAVAGESFKSIHDKPITAGQAGIEKSYESIHLTPPSGWNLYRLRMNHKNGTAEYSEIKKVYFDFDQVVKILPNPFQHYFNIQPLNDTDEWQIRLFDEKGNLVISKTGKGSSRIDAANLPSGAYLLQWSTTKQRTVFKILKL